MGMVVNLRNHIASMCLLEHGSVCAFVSVAVVVSVQLSLLSHGYVL